MKNHADFGNYEIPWVIYFNFLYDFSLHNLRKSRPMTHLDWRKIWNWGHNFNTASLDLGKCGHPLFDKNTVMGPHIAGIE
jgi:hypothetical protein